MAGRHNPFRLVVLMAAVWPLGAPALVFPQSATADKAKPSPANPRPVEPSVGGYRIAGVLVSKIDSHPLSRARVTIRNVKNQQPAQSAITADDGRFEFNGLPAGKFALQGAKRGFLDAFYDQHDQFSTAIVTGAGLPTEDLVLKLAPDVAISGRVLDEAGDPVRHATVTLYYDDHQQGIEQIHGARTAQTNDLGAYEIPRLVPGTYFLSASARPWYALHPPSEAPHSQADESTESAGFDRSLDVAYPVTYYPDVTEAESATPIPLRGGERLQLDIHLNPVPALRLVFHSPRGDNYGVAGKPGLTFPQLEQSTFEGSTVVPGSGLSELSPGVWELAGIPAGRYNIRVQGAPGLQMSGVDLTRDLEEIDVSSAQPLSNVKISVQMPGNKAIPPELLVGLRAKDRTFAGGRPVEGNEPIDIQGIAAGPYEVMAWAPGKAYNIGGVTAEGAEVSYHTVTITPGTSASLSLSLVMGSVEINGTVKRDGKACAGAMVVLVPKNPEGARDFFRRDQSDLDGSFVLPNVVPGTYTLVAIDNGWDLDWSRPEVIAVYARHGRTIEVRNQGQPLRVPGAIEVQSK